MSEEKSKLSELEDESRKSFLIILATALFLMTYLLVGIDLLAESKHERQLAAMEYEYKFRDCSKE